jgi:hypothetical protein
VDKRIDRLMGGSKIWFRELLDGVQKKELKMKLLNDCLLVNNIQIN